MEKHAYLLISDLHDSYKKKENRYSYEDEIRFVKKKLISVIQDLSGKGHKVFLIFMGDVFDTGYRDVFSSTIANNFFIFLRGMCDGMYLLFGNHELTYYSGNPIYTLIQNIESEKVRGIQNKMWKPQGLFQTFSVVDQITDGDTVIHFNHYGTRLSKPVSGKVNIALYHQDVVCPEILEDMQARQKRTLYGFTLNNFDDSGIFEGIDFNFFGHMHSVYGEWTWESACTGWKSKLQYLASLGRPNYLEVNNDFLERDMPAIVVEDGKFSGIIHNRFVLPTYEECVRSEIVAIEKKNYESIKERKEIRSYLPTSDDPVRNLYERCTTAEQQTVLKELLTVGTTSAEKEIKERIREVLYSE